ncbi:MAG TPA: serine/threonine-protein kinase [Kofleriaceae bacterium]|nr:serine/threonine-protein kinase [Kofleriaceae bacterium]
MLRERIGVGGSGEVYRCAQPTLDREVVVKVLHAARQAKLAAHDRFVREAQLATKLEHPYAAHVYTFGVAEGLPWIAMELVRGIALDQWLREHGRMPFAQFVPFFECLADVVQFAHERRIVHRDLKPSNVMVIERNGRLIPKLLDLGLAKSCEMLTTPAVWAEGTLGEHAALAHARTGTVTRGGFAMGSAAYMAPEQWDNAHAVGPATDIYALGVLAYEVLTGRTPFTVEADREGDFYHHHRSSRVPPLGDGVPAELDRVIGRALAKNPRERHETAAVLAADFRAVLRASEREHLRAAAQQWIDRDRHPDLLWNGEVLAGIERWMLQVPASELSPLECSFVAASQGRARRLARLRRFAGVALAVAATGGGLAALYDHERARARLAEERAQAATRVADATLRQSELDQGRSALLHGEPEAQRHLIEAYTRGDHSPGTKFMLARALQPRLTEKARFAATVGRMWSAAFSPDGAAIVTTDDRAAQVWDAATYRLRFRMLHNAEVYQAIYTGDGARLITIAQDAVRIWNAADGALVRVMQQPRKDRRAEDYFVGALSADGRRVAAFDAAGSLARVWDTATGALVAELGNEEFAAPRLAFSADGRWLATTGGNEARVFDTRTWQRVSTLPVPRTHRLAFDPTGPRLLTGAKTGEAALWTIPDGTKIQQLRGAGEAIEAVAFSPDGRFVAAAAHDGSEQIWNATSGKLQSQLNPRRSKILAVEFDRSATLIASSSADGAVVIADVSSGVPVNVIDGSRATSRVVHFDPSGRRLTGASRDGVAWLWNADLPYRRWSAPAMSDDCGIFMNAEIDRRFVAVGCRDLPTRVWDTARGELLASLPNVSPIGGDFASAFATVSSDGTRAAIARNHDVEIYALPGQQRIRTIHHDAAVNAVSFVQDGRDVVSGAIDGSLIVTREDTTQLSLPTSSDAIDAVALLGDGRVVATDIRRHLKVYDRGGGVRFDLALPTRVMSLRIEGSQLVALPIYVDQVSSPILIDLEHGHVIAALHGHKGPVFSAHWIAHHRILTTGSDGVVRAWDAYTGQLLQSYHGLAPFTIDAALSPDGATIVAGSTDGILQFWDTASGALLWRLQAQESDIIGVHFEGNDLVSRSFTGAISRWSIPDQDSVIQACINHERCAIVLE